MNFYELLLNRGKSTGEGMTHFERLFAAKFGGSPPPEVREYTGAVPVTITADGTPLIDFLISGNMEQSGTPSSENPIMPQGTGERTAQLFDYQTGTPTAYKYLDENGNENEVSELAPWYITDYIPIPDGVLSVTLSKICGGVPAMCAYDASKNYITGIKYDTGSAVTKVDITLTSSTPIHFIRFSYFLGNAGYDDISTKMLNSGSTALPYEPYGYKIPISSANTTTPVYLGEVETTRKIKKQVFKGTENWRLATSDKRLFVLSSTIIDYYRVSNEDIAICSHYPTQSNVEYQSQISEGYATFYARGINNYKDFYIYDTTIGTVSEFKAYLAAQYAAGTPVTIWYVLAEPETAVVNEPLMKIGNYADTLSMEQAGVQIPTNKGSTTVDVDTTLKPSEVYIKYMG